MGGLVISGGGDVFDFSPSREAGLEFVSLVSELSASPSGIASDIDVVASLALLSAEAPSGEIVAGGGTVSSNATSAADVNAVSFSIVSSRASVIAGGSTSPAMLSNNVLLTSFSVDALDSAAAVGTQRRKSK